MECPPWPAGSSPRRTPTWPQGGPDNLRQLARFLSDTVAAHRGGLRAAGARCPTWGHLERPDRPAEPAEAAAADDPPDRRDPVLPGTSRGREHRLRPRAARRDRDRGRPGAAGVLLVAADRRAGADRRAARGRRDRRHRARGRRATARHRPARAATTRHGTSARWPGWTCPILQGLCLTSSRAQWADSDDGLSPLDAATQVAMPEFDGRMITVPFSFKEIGAGRPDQLRRRSRARRAGGRHRGAARAAAARPGAASGGSRSCCRRTRPSTPGSATPSAWTPPHQCIALLAAMAAAGYDIGGDEIPGVADGRRRRAHPRAHRGGRPGRGLADRRNSWRATRSGSAPTTTGVVRHPARGPAARASPSTGGRRRASCTSTAAATRGARSCSPRCARATWW